LMRLWSTDYFLDAPGCIERLHVQLNALLDADRATRAAVLAARSPEVPESTATVAGEDPRHEVVADNGPQPDGLVGATLPGEEPEQFAGREILLEASAASAPDAEAPISGASVLGSGPDEVRFYEDAYVPQLRQQCVEFVDRAGPVTLDYMAERIARAHGFARTG